MIIWVKEKSIKLQTKVSKTKNKAADCILSISNEKLFDSIVGKLYWLLANSKLDDLSFTCALEPGSNHSTIVITGDLIKTSGILYEIEVIKKATMSKIKNEHQDRRLKGASGIFSPKKKHSQSKANKRHGRRAQKRNSYGQFSS